MEKKSTLSRLKKAKKKRRNPAPELDEETKRFIDETIRIRTQMEVRDLMGRAKAFRSTIAENQTEGTEDKEAKAEGGSG